VQVNDEANDRIKWNLDQFKPATVADNHQRL